MQKAILSSLILLALVFSSGCAQNGYSKFYTDFNHKYSRLDTITFQRLQADHQPQLLLGSNLQQDSFSMQVNGYVPIGYSSFQGRLETVDKALAQAQKVGATHVLIYSYAVKPEEIASYRPVEVRVANQSADNAEKPLVETAGFSRARGYIQAASYWVEREQWEFGAYVEELPLQLKQQTGLVKGCSLAIVVAGSSADRAGLVSGDVVVQLSGSEIAGPQDFRTVLEENHADRIPLLIYRDGEYLQKVVALGDDNARLAAKSN